MKTRICPLYAIAFVALTILLLPASLAFAGGSNCVEKGNNNVDVTGKDGSRCFAGSDGTGVAHSRASGSGSFAEAIVTNEGGDHGKAKATAKGGASAVANGDGGHATATAMGVNSSAGAQAFSGTAKAVALSGGDASSLSNVNCNTSSIATGDGSLATAGCGTDGETLNAKATGGGVAQVSDSAASCTANGGTAVVTGSGHTCNAP